MAGNLNDALAELNDYFMGEALKLDRESMALIEKTWLRVHAEMYKGILELIDHRMRLLNLQGPEQAPEKIVVQ